MNYKSFEKLLIMCQRSIRDAMKKLDDTAQKIIYVIDDNKQLVGALSDGDIRRALLKGHKLDDNIELIMNSNPKYVIINEANYRKKAKNIMLQYGIESLPVIDGKNIIVDVIYWVDVFKEEKIYNFEKKQNKVFILAGGKGSRLEPFTKVLPKSLVPIGDQPIIEKIMDKFSCYGFSNFIISLNYKAELIKMYLGDKDIKLKYDEIIFVQEEMPLGTIGSLHLAKGMMDDTFFITNSDILIEEDINKIYDFHKQKQCILTIVGCIKDSIIPYGVLNTDSSGYLKSINEKPVYSHVINTGIYVAEPAILKYLKDSERQDITEVIERILENSEKIAIYPILDEQWFDIGQWAEYERTRKYFEINI